MENKQFGFTPVVVVFLCFTIIVAGWFFYNDYLKFQKEQAESGRNTKAETQKPAEIQTANKQDSLMPAIEPKQLTRQFNAGAVFGAENSFAGLRNCLGESALDCQTAELKKMGASDDAVEFWRQSDWGIMANYTGYGDNKSGYYALLDVLNPLAANSNNQPAFLSGKNLWYVMDTDSAKIGGISRLASEFKAGETIDFARSEFVGLNKRGEAVFVVNIIAGCRACGTGYEAAVGYKVDPSAPKITANLLGFCSEAGTINSKYPACSYETILNY